MSDKPFYIYRILGEMGEIVYIGKGTGQRLAKQRRRFMSDGEIIERFSTERAAYNRERQLIAEHNPPLNKSAGGDGGQCGRVPSVGEEAMFAGVAKIIRKLKNLTDFTLMGVEVKRETIEQVVANVAAKYGPEEFARRLSQYGILVENRFVDAPAV